MRHVKPTRHMRRLGYVVAAAAALSAMAPEAMAEDSLKIAVARRGAWDTAAPDLGQRAGIFKKHGLTLDLTYPRAEERSNPRRFPVGSMSDWASASSTCCARMRRRMPRYGSSAQT